MYSPTRRQFVIPLRSNFNLQTTFWVVEICAPGVVFSIASSQSSNKLLKSMARQLLVPWKIWRCILCGGISMWIFEFFPQKIFGIITILKKKTRRTWSNEKCQIEWRSSFEICARWMKLFMQISKLCTNVTYYTVAVFFSHKTLMPFLGGVGNCVASSGGHTKMNIKNASIRKKIIYHGIMISITADKIFPFFHAKISFGTIAEKTLCCIHCAWGFLAKSHNTSLLRTFH